MVTTKTLFNHYVNVFNKVITKNKICIIEQGLDYNVCENYYSLIKKIGKKLVLLYFGMFYEKLREPKELYSAICHFPKGEILLKVYGPIKPKFLPPNIPQFYFGGNIPNENIVNEYRKSDVIVFIYNDYGIQIPGKLYEIIAVKKPILFIYSDNSPSKYILGKYNGFLPCLNKAENIYSAIGTILNGDVESNFDFPIEYYSWRNLSEKYLNNLTNILLK